MAAHPHAFIQQIQGWESWGSKFQVPREAKGKREEGTGKNDLLLRLVDPEGPADLDVFVYDIQEQHILTRKLGSSNFNSHVQEPFLMARQQSAG